MKDAMAEKPVESGAGPQVRQRVGFALFLLLVSCYLLTFNLHVLSTSDERQRFEMLTSLLHRGSLDVYDGAEAPHPAGGHRRG